MGVASSVRKDVLGTREGVKEMAPVCVVDRRHSAAFASTPNNAVAGSGGLPDPGGASPSEDRSLGRIDPASVSLVVDKQPDTVSEAVIPHSSAVPNPEHGNHDARVFDDLRSTFRQCGPVGTEWHPEAGLIPVPSRRLPCREAPPSPLHGFVAGHSGDAHSFSAATLRRPAVMVNPVANPSRPGIVARQSLIPAICSYAAIVESGCSEGTHRVRGRNGRGIQTIAASRHPPFAQDVFVYTYGRKISLIAEFGPMLVAPFTAGFSL